MAIREEVTKILATVFAVTIEKWDDRNYPYHDTESLWEDHLQAAGSVRESQGNDKRKIVIRQLEVLNTGRVAWRSTKTVWEAGKWVSPEHDPRSQDPGYREYLRLKEIYGDD